MTRQALFGILSLGVTPHTLSRVAVSSAYGSVLDVEMTILDKQSKGVPIDEQANDFLGVPFARTMHVGVEMAFVRTPMIGIKTREPEGLQERFELQKDCVFAAPKNIRQDSTRV